MDDLVYICTKLARQMDVQGLDKIFDTAEAAMGAIEEARPLLQRAVELVNEVRQLFSMSSQHNDIAMFFFKPFTCFSSSGKCNKTSLISATQGLQCLC